MGPRSQTDNDPLSDGQTLTDKCISAVKLHAEIKQSEKAQLVQKSYGRKWQWSPVIPKICAEITFWNESSEIK